jgi:uncharacterized protein YifE (UPF0438 family)
MKYTIRERSLLRTGRNVFQSLQVQERLARTNGRRHFVAISQWARPGALG